MASRSNYRSQDEYHADLEISNKGAKVLVHGYPCRSRQGGMSIIAEKVCLYKFQNVPLKKHYSDCDTENEHIE